jgi:hypothetical protein
MLKHSHTRKRALTGVSLTFVVVSIVGCNIGIISDTVKEGISLEEAQELLPFQVCLPGYVPDGVKISKTVRYHAEFGDPNESDITVDYFSVDKETPVFTVYERHGPGGKSDFHDKTTQHVSMRRLMAWQLDWETTEEFEKEIDRLDRQGIIEYQVYTFDSERLIAEIKSPDNLKAVLITWDLSEHVLIDIYSHLSVEETKLIANSVMGCDVISTVIP